MTDNPELKARKFDDEPLSGVYYVYGDARVTREISTPPTGVFYPMQILSHLVSIHQALIQENCRRLSLNSI